MRAFALALLLVGCGNTTPMSICAPPACTPTATTTYGAEVIATDYSGSALPPFEISALTADSATGSYIMTLPAFATVSGTVTASGAPVPGTISFTRPSRLPGRPDVYYPATVDAQTGAYSVSVPPNTGSEVYTIRVLPTDPTSFPPTSLSMAIASSQTLDIPLPTGDSLINVTGVLTDALSVPVDGATVSIKDASTLAVLSTQSVTSNAGHFAVSLTSASTSSPSALLLSIQRGDAGTGLETLLVEISQAQVAAQLLRDTLRVQLPALPSPTHLSFRVIGTSTSGSDEPVAGAHYVLHAGLLDTNIFGTTVASHQVEGLTDSDGNLSADLYSDTSGTRSYTIDVTPLSDSDYESISSTITVGSASGVGQPIRLSVRPQVTGRVLDVSGAVLPGAVVQPTSTSLATTTTPGSATSDATGRFGVRIDPSTYDISIVPPATALLPRRWLVGKSVMADLDLGDVSLESPVMFDAVVLGPDQNGAQVTLRIYGVPSGNAACAPDDTTCLAPPRLQAEGMTDVNGRVPLLLPSDGT